MSNERPPPPPYAFDCVLDVPLYNTRCLIEAPPTDRQLLQNATNKQNEEKLFNLLGFFFD